MYRFGALLGVALVLCACPTKDNPVWGLGGESESGGSDSSASTVTSATSATSSTTSAATTDDTSSSTASGSTSETPDPVNCVPGPGELPVLAFGEEEEITILNSIDQEQDPTVRSDEREMYFAARGMGLAGIYRSQRGPNPDDEWEPGVVVESLNDGVNNHLTPMLMTGGLTMTLSRAAPMAPADVHITTRTSLDSDDWTTPMPIPSLDGGVVFSTHLIDGGRTAYFCSTRAAPTEALFRAFRQEVGMDFETPLIFETGLGSDLQCNPWISEDESLLLFRASLATFNDQDLYMMRGADGVLNPAEILEVSNPDDSESDPWLVVNPDTCQGHLYFTREEEVGDSDIWWVEVTLGVE